MSVLLRKQYSSIKKEKLSEQAKSVLKSMYDTTDGFKDVKATRKIKPKFEAFYNKLKESKPEAIVGAKAKSEAAPKKSADEFKAARQRRKPQTGVPKDKKAVDKDATRPAISKRGRRVSKAGNTYYEYRENRLDKNPSKYPMLEKGGELDWANDENEQLGKWLLSTKSGKHIIAESKNSQELEKNVRDYAKDYDGIAGLAIDDEDEGLEWVTFDDLYNEIHSRKEKGGYMEDGGETAKFQVDDVVYHKQHNTIGIVRIEESRGEVKTDADGNVNVDELEYYNPMKHESHKNAKIAPSTMKEIEERGLWNPFSERTSKLEKGGETGELMGASQNGEPKPSGYFLVKKLKTTAIVRDEDGNLEKYGKSPNFAGYHLIIDGEDYEFLTDYNEKGGYMADGGEIASGFSIDEMKEYLEQKFPYSFGFKVYPIKKNTTCQPDYDAEILKGRSLKGLSSADLGYKKLTFPKYKRDHEINFDVQQGGENTYFNFLLSTEDGNEYYSGTFGFKDQGDVDSDYVTGFIAFLMESYGLPFKVNHSVYAKGGETHRLDSIFEDGGEIAESNLEMAMTNVKAIEHHAMELKSLLDENTSIEAWVVAKLERAETDLSDVTHYIDGLQSEKDTLIIVEQEYAKGGYMEHGGETMKEAYVQQVVEIATKANQNGIKASDLTYEEFSNKVFEATNTSYAKEYLRGAYEVMKNKGYAKGGELTPYIIWVSKDGEKREMFGEYKSKRAADMKMNKLWETGEYKTMGNKPKSMYEREGYYGEGGMMANGGRIKVGTFNEEQLVNKEDKKAVEKAREESGLKYVDTKIIKKGGKMYMEVYLIPNEEYYNSSKFSDGGMMAKGGGIYSSDSLYILQVLKNGEEFAREKFRAKSLKEAKEISQDEFESMYIEKLGEGVSFIVVEAMEKGGETDNWDVRKLNDEYYPYGLYLNNSLVSGLQSNDKKSVDTKKKEIKERLKMEKGGRLSRKQKQLDLNKNGKLDSQDFKMLRAGRKNARKK